MLSLVSLTKRFPGGQGVLEVSLEVAKGEVFALLGASGSGKSTLLNLAAGLLPPDQGQVFIGGQDVTRLAPERRRVGYVFQDLRLWPHLSAFEHLLLVMPKPDRKRALALLEQTGLLEHAAKRPGQLSGGQRQRVALARALAREPQVILLDEPYSALDPVLRERLRLDVRTVLKEAGVTALHVTHDPEEAMLLADRVGVMSRGRLVQVGTPEAVYWHPTSLESFLAFGRANLLYRNGEALAFRQEWVREGGELEGRVLERRSLRGEVICRVQLPWGEAWVCLERNPGETVRLDLQPLLRYPAQP